MPVSRWLAIALLALAAFVVAPFAPVITLAIWVAVFAGRIHRPLTRLLRGRSHSAAAITVGGLALLSVPIALILTSVVTDAIALVQRLLATPQVKGSLETLVSGDGDGHRSLSQLVGLAVAQGGRAWSLATRIAGVAASVAIALLIFFTGVYSVLIDGKAWYGWIERHAPIAPPAVRRLADAFMETGRGLFIGIGGAGLIQATVATIAYLVLGVPHALALGLITLAASVIPAVGTGIVWVPVAAGLALTGRTGAAIAMAIIGVGVIGTVDNLARPWLTRRGHLQLPTFVVLVSMFGGIELLGGWGLLMGPLVVRLAGEVLLIAREQREAIA